MLQLRAGLQMPDWLQMIGTWTFTNGFVKLAGSSWMFTATFPPCSIFLKQCAWSFSGQYFFEKNVLLLHDFLIFAHVFSQLRIGPPGLLRFLYCWQLLRTHHRASSDLVCPGFTGAKSPEQSQEPRSAALLGKRRRTGEWISAAFFSDPEKYRTIYIWYIWLAEEAMQKDAERGHII